MTEAPWIAVGIPWLGALLVLLARRVPNLREALTLATAGALFAFVASQILPAVLVGERVAGSSHAVTPGLELKLVVEPLGMVYGLIASLLWIVTSLYAVGYMRGNREENQTRFFFCFALSIGAAMGIAFAGNLFTLFVFYEVLTFSTFPLVTHAGTDKAKKAGRVYLGILVTTSVCFLLPAIIGVATYTGTTDFRLGGVFEESTGDVPLGLLFFLAIYGIGKAALMPFHRWLPAAMVAPTPVSALLHAVAVVKAGVFCVTKVTLYTFGVERLNALDVGTWLPYVAGFTILSASVVALRQDNLKRRLAYSTISQLSYVVLATSLLAPFSILAAIFHIAAHAFGKITLFFAAGSIYTAAHKTEVSQLDGIGRRMPITMTAFAIGSLSMIGVPPTAGFISKWYLLAGSWQSGEVFVLAVLALSTALNAGYFLPIVYRAFFRAPKATDHHDDHGEAPWPIVVALAFTALGTIVLFFHPQPFLDLGRAIVGGLG